MDRGSLDKNWRVLWSFESRFEVRVAFELNSEIPRKFLGVTYVERLGFSSTRTVRTRQSVASTRVQSWGGRSAEGGGVWAGCPRTGNTSSPPGRRIGGANFLFCDLKMAYFGEFCGAKFKVFLYRELPIVLGRFCGKFWIFEQTNE